MLNNFEKVSFPSIEKRWTKDKETDGKKERKKSDFSVSMCPFS